MIFDIALGVCLGIVLAALVLKYWRQILSGSVTVIVGALLVGLLIYVGVLVWPYLWKITAVAGAVLAVIVLYGVPFLIYGRVSRSYPAFNALIKGEAPWNQPACIPARLLVMALFALAVAAIGVVSLLGGVALVDYMGSLW